MNTTLKVETGQTWARRDGHLILIRFVVGTEVSVEGVEAGRQYWMRLKGLLHNYTLVEASA